MTPDPTCDAGLSLLFDGKVASEAAKTVESGVAATWDETATIAASATPGSTLACRVEFRVGQESIFTQNISITVSGTRTLEFGISGEHPELLRAHGVYDCGDGERVLHSSAQRRKRFRGTSRCSMRTSTTPLRAAMPQAPRP